MSICYRNRYYDHFSNKEFHGIPDFQKNRNYMMRFVAPLASYSYINNNLTITYIKDGVGELFWKGGNGKRVKIEKNRFVVVNPSCGWDYINENQTYIDALSLVISDPFRKQLNFYNEATTDQLLNTPFGEADGDSFYIENLLNANYYGSGKLLKKIHGQSTSDAFKFLAPEELTIELLQQLSREQRKAQHLSGKIRAKKRTTRIETFKRLLVAYEYIHDNITDPISLEALSKASCLSKYHLYESFRNVYGKTPHQYINRLKMAKSKEYLEQGQFSIAEISDLLGFSDYAVFSKAFKKIYGRPPSFYLA